MTDANAVSLINTPIKKYKKFDYYLEQQEAYDSAKGENSLWVAVISQAITDARSKCKKAESVYHKNEAINWLTGNSKDFIDVCLCAGMNPDYVRRKAKQAIISPANWRAEAGKGKRYEERKKYREKQKIEKNNPQKQSAEILQMLTA